MAKRRKHRRRRKHSTSSARKSCFRVCRRRRADGTFA